MEHSSSVSFQSKDQVATFYDSQVARRCRGRLELRPESRWWSSQTALPRSLAGGEGTATPSPGTLPPLSVIGRSVLPPSNEKSCAHPCFQVTRPDSWRSPICSFTASRPASLIYPGYAETRALRRANELGSTFPRTH